MASKRNISQRKPQFGQRRSHSMQATKRQFKLNMQWTNVYVPELGRTVRIRVSVGELKTIDKIGLSAFLKRQGLSLNQVRKF